MKFKREKVFGDWKGPWSQIEQKFSSSSRLTGSFLVSCMSICYSWSIILPVEIYSLLSKCFFSGCHYGKVSIPFFNTVEIPPVLSKWYDQPGPNPESCFPCPITQNRLSHTSLMRYFKQLPPVNNGWRHNARVQRWTLPEGLGPTTHNHSKWSF